MATDRASQRQQGQGAPVGRRGEAAPSRYAYSMNYDDPLLAYLYDQVETFADDLELLRGLIGDSQGLNVLECFSGTGRLLIPLAQDGHCVTGIEMAAAMNARTAAKVAQLPAEVRERISLRVQDALDGGWGEGYDLVILAANALYELPSAGAQERCIALAAEALASGGHVFIDNDDYKGDWGGALSRRPRIVFEGSDPEGRHGRLTLHAERFDERRQVLHMRRVWSVREPDGVTRRVEYRARKRPVRYAEVATWLERHGLRVIHVFGSRRGTPYQPHSGRAIFWAERAG